MGRYNFSPLRVSQATQNLLTASKIPRLPDWHTVVRETPPSQPLIRTQPLAHPVSRIRLQTVVGPNGEKHVSEVDIGDDSETASVYRDPNAHRKKGSRPKARKPSKLFQPVDIKYEEDELRKEFYRDHPWELARPRVLLEDDGNDRAKEDWNHIEQTTRKVDGESVIQRTLHLLQTVPDITPSEALNKARRELYQARLKSHIEAQIAQSEALYVGAHFGLSTIDISADLERKEYEKWETWASSQVDELERRKKEMYTDFAVVKTVSAEEELEPGEEKRMEDLDALEVEEPAPSTPALTAP
ncbi:MAG: mitochondrial ribosomal small subunit component [Cirrosporium novae-zelandiae]|nr:MAG: mitochondrial ribosomal small subunit component [Cirrosporium novae-zelandiae]